MRADGPVCRNTGVVSGAVGEGLVPSRPPSLRASLPDESPRRPVPVGPQGRGLFPPAPVVRPRGVARRRSGVSWEKRDATRANFVR